MPGEKTQLFIPLLHKLCTIWIKIVNNKNQTEHWTQFPLNSHHDIVRKILVEWTNWDNFTKCCLIACIKLILIAIHDIYALLIAGLVFELDGQWQNDGLLFHLVVICVWNVCGQYSFEPFEALSFAQNAAEQHSVWLQQTLAFCWAEEELLGTKILWDLL